MAKWYDFLTGKRSKKPELSNKNFPGNKLRSYTGANVDRLTSEWLTSGTSADAEIKMSIKNLRNRARELARNNSYVRQYLRAVQNNVVGRGVILQCQNKSSADLILKDINKKIESEWYEWCRKENCHTSGKLSFVQIERLIIRARAESGEVFVRIINRKFGKSKVPMALEIIEADLLDDDYNGTSPDGNEIRMGIELNEWGRPLFYYFKRHHPGDYLANSKGKNDLIKIPASEIIHLFRTERPNQTRGVTDLASSIIRLHHLSGYEEATIIQKRADASVMGFIETPEGEVRPDDIVNGESVTEFEPGVFKTLAPGEKVNVPNLSKSTGEYEPFTRSQLRAVAAGTGASYETISRDYSQSNYSSSRLSLIDDRDNWRVEQDWLIENFHQEVFEKWLELAVLSNLLRIADYELNTSKYTNVKWMARGWSWVDPQKEITAALMAIEGGLDTRTNIVAQSGNDFLEVAELLNMENEISRKLGLSFNTVGKMKENEKAEIDNKNITKDNKND